MNETLANYDEVESEFAERPCLLRMLKAYRFQSFEMQECIMNRSAPRAIVPIRITNYSLTAKECSPF